MRDTELSQPKSRLLRSNASFRRLFFARSISYVGDAVALTALMLHVEATVGVGVAVSALLLAHSIPNSLLGPVAGTIADRVDQRTLMVVTDVGRGLLFVSIAAFLPSFPVLVGLMSVAAMLEAGFRPAGRAAIPALVDRTELLSANAWLVSALNAGFAIGPIIGGLLVAGIGVPGALYVNAGTFFLSAALIVQLPPFRLEESEGERLGFFVTLREGLAFARRDRVMRAIVIGLVIGVAAGGLDNVALVFMATDVFHSGPTGFGLLETSFGVGMLGASLWLVRKTKMSASSLFALGWFGTAIAAFGVGVAPALAFGVAAQMVGGIGNGIGLVGGDTMLQEHVPEAMRGRAIGIAGSAPFIGSLVAYGVGGFLVDSVGARGTFVVSGIATTVVAIVIWAMVGRVGVTETA